MRCLCRHRGRSKIFPRCCRWLRTTGGAFYHGAVGASGGQGRITHGAATITILISLAATGGGNEGWCFGIARVLTVAAATAAVLVLIGGITWRAGTAFDLFLRATGTVFIGQLIDATVAIYGCSPTTCTRITATTRAWISTAACWRVGLYGHVMIGCGSQSIPGGQKRRISALAGAIGDSFHPIHACDDISELAGDDGVADGSDHFGAEFGLPCVVAVVSL